MIKRLLIGLFVAIGIIGLGLGLQYLAPPNNPQPDFTSTMNTSPEAVNNEPIGIEDSVIGEGPEVKSGDTVVIHYRGTLSDGTQFESSYERGEPFTTPIGQGVVIKGWDEGVPGMKVGGKRKLTIPASKGYGAEGRPPIIPPNADLIFEVELLEIQ